MVAPSGEWMCNGARNVKNGKCCGDVNVSVIFGVNLPQRGIYP